VETIENQSGAVLDKNMFVHAFGPNVANGASIKVATLTYVLAGTLRAVFDRDEFPADPKTNWTYENSPNNDGAAPPNANNNQGTQTEVPEVPGGGGGDEPSTEQPAQESGYTCFFPPDLQKKKEEDKANDTPGVVCALPLPPASAMLAPGSNPAEQGNTAQNNSTCGPSDDPCGPNYPDNAPWCTTPSDHNGDNPEEEKEKKKTKCNYGEYWSEWSGKCENIKKSIENFCKNVLGLKGAELRKCTREMNKKLSIERGEPEEKKTFKEFYLDCMNAATIGDMRKWSLLTASRTEELSEKLGIPEEIAFEIAKAEVYISIITLFLPGWGDAVDIGLEVFGDKIYQTANITVRVTLDILGVYHTGGREEYQGFFDDWSSPIGEKLLQEALDTWQGWKDLWNSPPGTVAEAIKGAIKEWDKKIKSGPLSPFGQRADDAIAGFDFREIVDNEGPSPYIKNGQTMTKGQIEGAQKLGYTWDDILGNK
jgi:hypothetical protein